MSDKDTGSDKNDQGMITSTLYHKEAQKETKIPNDGGQKRRDGREAARGWGGKGQRSMGFMNIITGRREMQGNASDRCKIGSKR